MQLTIEQTIHERDRAMQRVDENADTAWKTRALEAVRRTCEQHAEWHSDDVWATGLDEPREARALGPVVLRAIRNGWCVKTDRVRPSVRSHGSGKPVYRSLIYRGAA